MSFTNGDGTFPHIEWQGKNGTFDPFADLFSTQQARPAQLGQVDLRTLTPFQRALLVIDGTVTKFLEAYTLEPVEVVLLKQEIQALVADHKWLALPAETEIVARQVLLRGRYSATVYVYAVSLLVQDRLPSDMLGHLKAEPSGLGRVLLNSQIENRREILWYGHESLDNLPSEISHYTGNDFISRTYRIIAGGKPTMLINEKFPARLAWVGNSSLSEPVRNGVHAGVVVA
jgi:chorismate-pyruvate lyase